MTRTETETALAIETEARPDSTTDGEPGAGTRAREDGQASASDPAAATSMIEDPRTVRFLHVLVIVMGVILVAGFIAVIARIAYLVSRSGEPAPQAGLESVIPTDGKTTALQPTAAATTASSPGSTPSLGPTQGRLALPPDAEIVRMDPLTVGANRDPRIFVHFRTVKDGSRTDAVAVFDGVTGKRLRLFHLGSETLPATP
jgi:hypothetical protein